MSKYFFVYCDGGVLIKAPSEEKAVEIFENKFYNFTMDLNY